MKYCGEENVTVADFKMKAIKMRYCGQENKTEKHPACIFLFSFCITCYMDDERYLRSDRAHGMLQRR